jgi:molecular chaperone DnaK
MKKLQIGIDLGTTNSVVAYLENGSIEYLRFRNQESISSVMLYKDGKITIGDKAKKKAVSNPRNFIKSSKTFMGDSAKSWSIEDKTFTPTDVATEVLKEIKKALDKKFSDISEFVAVITVPAYFTSTQIDETKKAGESAGFTIKQIITEPVSAAVAYGFEDELNQKLFIVDIGGGTFDTSILNVSNRDFETLAIDGDSKLGGDDFDNHILEYLLKHIRKERGVNLASFEKSGIAEDEFIKAKQALITKSEDIKKELSEYEEVEIEISNLLSGYNLSTKLTKDKFEDISSITIDKIKRTIKKTLDNSGYTPNNIDKVVLVGGSSKIPVVREFVTELFGKAPYSDKPLDKLVAMGAVIVAQDDNAVNIKDIISHSLGIEVLGNSGNFELEKMLLKNSYYPISKDKIFTTTQNNQKEVKINIFEGDIVEDIDSNKFYGELTLDNIENALAGVPEIKVTFHFDNNRILTVKAENLSTNEKKEITIVKCTKEERTINLDSILMLKTGDSANLSKLGFDLKNLTTVLGWDANSSGGHAFDLDSSLITLNNNNIVETISFSNLNNSNCSILHHGDNLTGEGDAEKIDINLEALPSNVNRLIFIINIYDCSNRSQHFGMIENTYVSIINSSTGKELLQYDIREKHNNKTAMFIAELKKENDMWIFNALGKSNNYLSIEELENNLRDIN